METTTRRKRYDDSRHRNRNRKNKRDGVLTLVYLVQAGPFIKIGIAENLKSRLIVIQNGCPILVEVVYHSIPMPRPMAREIEIQCHNHIIEHHVRGEWFKAPPEMVVDFLRSIAPQDSVPERENPQLRLIA